MKHAKRVFAATCRFFRALGEAFVDVWVGDDDFHNGERR